jgi:hypothetical protein
MSTQTEAQRLARLCERIDELDSVQLEELGEVVGTELRRLEAEVQALRGAVPAGWKLVPIEPTEEMLDAADAADREYTRRNFGDVMTVMQGPYDHWCAMVAAAPQPAAQRGEVVPDMFWNSDDADQPHDSIECLLNDQICQHDIEVGAVFTIWRAKKLPALTIRVTAIDSEECEAEYEVIEQAQTPQPAQGEK